MASTRSRAADDGCARRSASAGEEMLASAGRTRAWVVLEWPGTWSADPLGTAAVPAASELVRRTRELGLRLTLARRYDRGRRPGRQLYLVWTGPGQVWAEQATVDGPEALRDVDLAALAGGCRPGFGRPLCEPVFLVCTHGRKDPCCARLGRPAFRALATAFGGQVWESTHLGGDRFAANLVCLPHGLSFGRVGPADARRIANAYREGRIELGHFRGRPCYSAPVQAAAEGEPRPLVCREPQPARPPTYRLVDLRRTPRSGSESTAQRRSSPT